LKNSESSNQVGIKLDADVSDCMTSEGPGAVAFRPAFFTRSTRSGAPSDVAPPLMDHGSGGLGDTDPVVLTAAMRESGQGYWVETDVAGSLDANMGMSGHASRPAVMAFNTYERRLSSVSDPITTTMATSERGVLAFSSKDDGQDAGPLSLTLRSGNNANSNASGGAPPAVAIDTYNQAVNPNTFQTLRNTNGTFGDALPAVLTPLSMVVRRLTATECERLQGFPDGYTLIPYRNKPAADGPRYKALGNSMAVPVMRWIGTRIALVEKVR